jgi:bidirectional [NiFe] hydrogenase diaphorase subunit
VAGSLRVPPSRVYGVATFYSYFMLEPQGAHTCVVCMGTACYINGATKLLDGIVEALGVGAGQTTSDGQISVPTAHCVGACSVAPVVVLDGEVHGKLSAESVVQEVREL